MEKAGTEAPLRSKDFCPGVLEELEEELGWSRRAVLREINLFRDILQKYACLFKNPEGFFLRGFVIELFRHIETVRKLGIKGDKSIRAEALASLADWFWRTHVNKGLLEEETNKLILVAEERDNLEEENTELRIEIDKLSDSLHEANQRIERYLRQIQALKDICSAIEAGKLETIEKIAALLIDRDLGFIFGHF